MPEPPLPLPSFWEGSMFTREARFAKDHRKSLTRWRDRSKCAACGSRKELNIHHKTYSWGPYLAKGRGALVIVCAACHRAIHDEHRGAPDRLLWNVTEEFIFRAKMARS